MDEKKVNSNIEYTLVNTEIKLKTDVKNLYDLTYTLVDLQSIYGSLYHIMLGNDINLKVNTTTRNFNEKYKDALILNGFQNGSIIFDALVSIASTLIGEFLKRTIWSDSDDSKMTIIYKDCIVINADDDRAKSIIIRNCNINKELNNEIDTKEFVDEFFNSIDIKKGKHEENLKSFLKELEKRGYIRGHETYSRDGIKVVVNNIHRFEARV